MATKTQFIGRAKKTAAKVDPEAKKRSDAAKKAWKTRRANAAKK